MKMEMKLSKKFSMVICCILLIACKHGSTNSSERTFDYKDLAKNQMVAGLKEGMWVDFMDSLGYHTTEQKAALYLVDSFKAGKKVGMEKMYYKNGVLCMETPYVDGLKNGVSKKYYPDGKLLSEMSYENDHLESAYKTYYENGKLKSSINFTDSGPVIKKYDEKGKQLN
jgi:antitoxin component YwqK of YwqJK toxin-antitoxin module